MDARHVVIPVALQPVSVEVRTTLPDQLQELHWLDARGMDDDQLLNALRLSVSASPATAAQTIDLQRAAVRWRQAGESTDLLPTREDLRAWRPLIAEQERAGVAPGALTHRYLTAARAAARLEQRRTWVSRIAVGAVIGSVLVALGALAYGQMQADQRMNRARSFDEASDHADVALQSLADNDMMTAIDEAMAGLTTASTPQTRQAARAVTAAPWPDVVIPVGEEVTAMRWSASGRYLAYGTTTGTLGLLDFDGRQILAQEQVTTSPIQRIIFPDPEVEEAPLALTLQDEGVSLSSRPVITSDWDDAQHPPQQSVSADGQFSLQTVVNGVFVLADQCSNDANGACHWWVSLPAGKAASAWWAPTSERFAVTDAAGTIGVVDVDRLVAGEIFPQEATAPDDLHNPRWALLAEVDAPTALVQDAESRLWVAPRETILGLDVPCLPPRRGAMDSYVPCTEVVGDQQVNSSGPPTGDDTGEFAAAAPATSPSSSGAVTVPMYKPVVAPSGTLAAFVGPDGYANILQASDDEWVLRHRAPGPALATPILPDDARFSPEEGVFAYVADDMTGGRTLVMVDTRTGSLTHVSTTAVSEDLDMVHVAEDSTVWLSSNGIGTAYPVLRFDGETGDSMSFDAPGNYLGHVEESGLAVTVSAAFHMYPWPDKVGSSGYGWMIRLTDFHTGETMCQRWTYFPHTRLASPDLRLVLDPSLEPQVGIRTCEPVHDPAPALIELRERLLTWDEASHG